MYIHDITVNSKSRKVWRPNQPSMILCTRFLGLCLRRVPKVQQSSKKLDIHHPCWQQKSGKVKLVSVVFTKHSTILLLFKSFFGGFPCLFHRVSLKGTSIFPYKKSSPIFVCFPATSRRCTGCNRKACIAAFQLTQREKLGTLGIVLLLMEEILHHLGCRKPCK